MLLCYFISLLISLSSDGGVIAQNEKHPWMEFPLPTLLQIQAQPNADDLALGVLQHTLSGLATHATRTRDDVPSLWIDTGTEPDDRWRSRFVERTAVPTQSISSDVVALVKAYAELGVVKGFVAYSPDSSGANVDVSVNIATSLCAPLGAVAAGGDVIAALEAEGVFMLANASELTYPDIMNGDYEFNRNVMAVLQTSQLNSRDLAVASGTLVVIDNPNGGFNAALATLNPSAAVIGYGLDEHVFTSGASYVGAGMAPSDWASNLPVKSSGPPADLGSFPARTPVRDDGESFYVAFALTDGDNIQWLLNDFTTAPFWFGSPRRGDIPFTWGLHVSALAQLAPDSLTWFQEQATGNDSILPWADSYAYLDVMHSANPAYLSTFVSDRMPYSHSVGLDSAVVFLEDWMDAATYETFVEADPDIKAIFPVQFSSYSAGEGAMLHTSQGVPVLSGRITVWDNGNTDEWGDPLHVADVLNEWANGTDSRIQDRVAWVPIIAWSAFTAPEDGEDLATDGRLQGYAAAEYIARHLFGNIKLVTLDDISHLLS